MIEPPVPKREVRVLLVDDEENIRHLLRVVLGRVPGLRVEALEARDAEEAMPIIRAHALDVVITDYRMGRLTGVDLLEFAARERPDARRVLVTAFADVDIGVDAVNRGRVDGFLRKPWENAQLVALFQHLVSRPEPPDAGASMGLAESTVPRERLDAEIAGISKAIQQLKVRLGLGTLSPDGYERATSELARRRAELEATRFGIRR